jgi:hypothetical protein
MATPCHTPMYLPDFPFSLTFSFFVRPLSIPLLYFFPPVRPTSLGLSFPISLCVLAFLCHSTSQPPRFPNPPSLHLASQSDSLSLYHPLPHSHIVIIPSFSLHLSLLLCHPLAASISADLFDRNFPCWTLKIRNVSLVVMGS